MVLPDLHRSHCFPTADQPRSRTSAHRPIQCSAVIFPLSIPGVISGITNGICAVCLHFVISQMLGSGKNLLVGDLIDLQSAGGAYNLHLAQVSRS